MTLGQFEFTLLASVLAAYIIFTPEPLVLLRNLAAWAVLTSVAWYGFQHWETSFWTQLAVKQFIIGHDASSMMDSVRDQVLCWRTQAAAAIRREGTRIYVGALTSVAHIFEWLRPVGIASNTTAGSGSQQYYAILVTTPPVHVYGPVSDQLQSEADEHREFSMKSTCTDSIPPMLSCLRFRRHFALCLVPTGVWKSTTKTLAEKFEGQFFWGYCNDEKYNSRAITWPTSRISEINAIEELGIVHSDSHAVITCTKCKYNPASPKTNDAYSRSSSGFR